MLREKITIDIPALHLADPTSMLPPFNAPIAQVLMEIKNKKFVKWLGKIKINHLQRNRNKNKYCEFHKDHDHNTKDYFQLKEQIADLIKRGYLRMCVIVFPRLDSSGKGYVDNRPTTSDIQTIHGGFASGECSSSSRKTCQRGMWVSKKRDLQPLHTYDQSSPAHHLLQ